MRLFVAVELDEEVVAAAADAGRQLQRRVEEHVRASWIREENMHLTVRFIGEVAEDRVAAVTEALTPPLPVPPFDLTLGECGAFPSPSRPRVFWIGLSRGSDELRQVHDDLNRRLRPLGFEPEDRPFSAHLTLARVKEMRPQSRNVLREAIESIHPRPASCRIDAATLFQSQLSTKGARYTRLLRIGTATR